MRGFPFVAALTLAAITSPALAGEGTSEDEAAVASAVDEFMDAIGSDDKTLLADHMIPEALIFIHNRMDPARVRVDTVPVGEHLERWAARTGDYEEVMSKEIVLVSGDMAQVWGPYSFRYNGTLAHCGINSISLVRGEDGTWMVGNTSFTMERPERCEAIGASWVTEE